MTMQLCSRENLAVFRVGVSAVALLLVLNVRWRAMATPVVTPAYGSACDRQMALRNADLLDDDGAAELAAVNDAVQGRVAIDVSSFRIASVDPAKTTRSGSPIFPCEYATAIDRLPGD